MRLRRCCPVLVFQMGKVGSSSVYFSLNDSYPGAVAHAHWLTDDHHLWRVRRIHRHAVTKGRPLNIVSLTREPVARNVSVFFQNFERKAGGKIGELAPSFRELREMFLRDYDPVNTERGRVPIEWFDEHIRDQLGIDVYDQPFPESGFATYAQGRVRLLVMRSELGDSEKEEAIRRFLALSAFRLQRHNVSAEKEYAAAYRDFKERLRVPTDYYDALGMSRYALHFYGEDKMARVRERWVE